MKKVLLLFLIWFVVINVFALLANNRVNLNSDTAYTWINSDYTFQKQGWDPADLHNRWDSYWYLDIAKNGYVFQGENQLSNLVFFPLFPLLVSFLNRFLHDFVISGWVVSSTFTLLAVYYLYKIVKEYFAEGDPLLAPFLLLIFPTAFFLNSIYSESVFLFFSVSSFYYAHKKRFLGAGVLGFFASLSRITGLLLFLPLLYELYKTGRKNFWSWRLLSLLLIPLGTFLFFLYHYLQFGDFFLFLKIQKWWGRGFSLNPDQFNLTTRPAIVNFSLDAFLLIVSLVAIVFAFKKLRGSYGIYMVSTLLVALSSGTAMSVGRYILVMFPIFILGSLIKNKIILYAWILISTLLLALYTLLFATHYWAG